MSEKTSLFMGRSLFSRGLHIALTDDRMMFTLAGSRGSKGVTAIIPNLLLWEGSALVVDPKGTNALVTARRRRAMGQEVFVFDPFRVLAPELKKINKTFFEVFGKDEPDSFNPLANLDLESLTIREDLAVISDAQVVPEPAQKDNHWNDGAKTGIGGFDGHLVSHPKYKDRASLPMIRDLLALDTDEFAELLADMSANRQVGDLARDAASRFIRGIDTDEIRNIISNMDRHTDWLSSPAMRDMLSQPVPSFRFSKLKETPTTAYLVIPPRFLDVHKRFLRLFINLALKEIASGGRSKIPLLLLIDEFQQLGKMPEIVKAYRLLAGNNVCIWCFAQDWPGVVELYGPSDAKSFLSNSRAVQVFSLNDEDSLELISKHIGTRSMTQVMGRDSLRMPRLRTPDEVGKEISRESNKQYILRAGAPLVLERVKYYEDQEHGLLARLILPYERFWRASSLDKPSWFRAPWRWFQMWLRKRYFPFAGLYDQDPDYAAPIQTKGPSSPSETIH
jgi:type IV secretory pathway TraG/TraD family ATPase VirD4